MIKAMKFCIRALGNSSGKIHHHGDTYQISGVGNEKEIDVLREDVLKIESVQGKFSDTEDSFIYCFTEVDPGQQNFSLSGRFHLSPDSKKYPDWLSGYGLLAADTAVSTGKDQRFRNSLAIGRYRMNTFHEFGCGLRIISGYDGSPAQNDTVRSRDTSRSVPPNFCDPLLTREEEYFFLLEKTDRGFRAAVSHAGKTEEFLFPGSDLLTKQDPGHIYVGLAVAGDLSVEISELIFETSSGVLSHTPEDSVHSSITEYPYPASLIIGQSPSPGPFSDTVYASPAGQPENPGTADKPLDLQTVLNAPNVKKIILKDGVYLPETSFYIGESANGRPGHPKTLTAEHPRRAVIDGSRIRQRTPAMILRGDYWQLDGIVFKNSRSNGIHICGSHNVIKNCEACSNGDSGFLICSFPGTEMDRWPKYNLVAFCDSHDNADEAATDADGFGAKLSVGNGNCFYECAACDNADDGFDLFTKRTIGPIGEVTIENCLALRNRGCGYKLGGEDQPVCHHILSSAAFGNGQRGFSSNSNPLSELKDLVSWQNGSSPSRDSYSLKTSRGGEPAWKLENLLPADSCHIVTGTVSVRNKRLEEEGTTEIFKKLDINAPVMRFRSGLTDLRRLLILNIKTPSAFFAPANVLNRSARKRRFRKLGKERQ